MHARALLVMLVLATACRGAEDARAKTAPDSVAAAPAPAATEASASPASNASATDPLVMRADSGRISGSASAKVWLIIASDFQCPYCKMWHDSADMAIRREYVDNGKIRFAFVNFPLSNHKNALPAAEYAMCASAQGKFWQMHDAIFEAQERWTPLADPAPVFDELASRVGTDAAAMRACLSSDKMLPMIQADHEKAAQSGVRATPSFFVGGQLLEGVQMTADLRRALDAAIAASPR